MKVHNIDDLDTIPMVNFTIGDETYYGIADFIRRFDVPEFEKQYRIQNKETGDVGNAYEFMWIILRDILQKDFESQAEMVGCTEEQMMEIVKAHYGNKT